MSDYYSRSGEPLDLHEWARLHRDLEYKRVDQTATRDAKVSTVWLGLDHGFAGGPPIIFETMVFGGELDGETQRYSTEEDARRGHAEMVERVRIEEAHHA